MTLVLVSGASGNVGREVVRACLARGLRVRAADRDQDRARQVRDVERTTLDYRNPATFSAAAEGADALFLLRPPAIANVRDTLLPFVDEARRRGVRQVVFLSVAGAAKNKLVPHHAVEQHLLLRSAGWTILRPGFFAQNFGDAYRRDIVEDSRVYVPARGGRVAFVDVRDLAEVAASAFASPAEHDGRAYTLTGPEAIDFETAASLLTDALGREIRYEPAGILGYLLHLRRRKMPWAQIGVQTVLHAGLRFGQAEHVDPTLERLLGRRPRTLREYIGDHRSLWLEASHD
jgi:uncharacterized protein YbjT (DUF2867 family)